MVSSGFFVRVLKSVRAMLVTRCRLARNRLLFYNSSSVSCAVRVFSVENLWRSLWERWWGKCGKVSTNWTKIKSFTQKVGKSRVLHVAVEKFYRSFPRWFFPVNSAFCTVSTRSTITTTYL